MLELIGRVPEHDLLALIVISLLIGCCTLVLLTAILARAWGKNNQRQLAVPLLQEMMDRGMQPAEIEEIFEAAWSARRGVVSSLIRRVTKGRVSTA